MPLDSAALSSRIATARVEAGLTQAELAGETGLERSVIAKIETGARGVSALELARIAEKVGQRIDWLLTEGPSAIVSHRVRRDTDGSVTLIDRELERLGREVEFLLERSPSFSLPRREQWSVPRSATDAETLAQRIRIEMGLGLTEPATRLAEAFAPLGLLLFVSDLGVESADGGTVLLDRGAVALVNGASRLGRRRMTAAHELAHFLVADDYRIDWRVSESGGTDEREALFDRFARAFLLPDQGVSEYWDSIVVEDFRAAAVQTASRYHVDMATLARRLSELGVISREDADRLRQFRTTKADILDYGLLVPYELEDHDLPSVYERAVLTAFRGERISAERALDLLRGKYEPSDLPALAPPREDELWSILG